MSNYTANSIKKKKKKQRNDRLVVVRDIYEPTAIPPHLSPELEMRIKSNMHKMRARVCACVDPTNNDGQNAEQS